MTRRDAGDTRIASIAVFPAPITATRVPACSGVSYAGKSRACIRLQRVSSSFADSTPASDSPGMPMKLGAPAPVPMKTAW